MPPPPPRRGRCRATRGGGGHPTTKCNERPNFSEKDSPTATTNSRCRVPLLDAKRRSSVLENIRRHYCASSTRVVAPRLSSSPNRRIPLPTLRAHLRPNPNIITQYGWMTIEIVLTCVACLIDMNPLEIQMARQPLERLRNHSPKLAFHDVPPW